MLCLFFSHSSLYRLLSSTLSPNTSKSNDQYAKVSWIKEPYQQGRRRVPVELYGRTLDAILQEAGDRSVSVLMLQPANIYRLKGMKEEEPSTTT